MNSLGNFIQKMKDEYEFRIKRKQIELLFWKAIAEAAEGDNQFLEMTRNQDYYFNYFLQDKLNHTGSRNISEYLSSYTEFNVMLTLT